MVTLLTRLLIRNRENYSDPKVRLAYGTLCGGVGVGLNLLLFLGKLLAGTLSQSIAVTADAFNNLSDAASSVVALVGFRLAGNAADSEHPFGHGRIEYVAGLVVSMAILLMGVELMKSSVEKILHPEPVTFSWWVAGILLVSILVKLYMYLYNRHIGKLVNSATMRATAMDSFSDMAATGVVLVCTFLGKWLHLSVDGYAGLLVALFILYTGFMAARETISPLLGEPPTKAYVEQIEALVLEDPAVIGVHDLVVHNYGPGRVMISLHAEVPADGDFVQLHDTIDNIEKKLREAMGCQTVIHMDPVLVEDEETKKMKRKVEAIVRCIDPSLSVHDFRVVPGHTHHNLVFDVVVPYSVKIGDEEVKRRIRDCVRELDGNYYAVIDVDKAMVQ